jgi:serine/threonine protein phosphatase PrpC
MSPSTSLRFAACGRTVTGLVRRNNEDNLWLARVGDAAARPGDGAFIGAPDFPGVLLAVADGMGGAKAGEVASRMAVEALAEELGRRASAGGRGEAAGIGEAAVQAAHAKIRDDARRDLGHEGMGTTLTAAWIVDGVADVFQVGDSRAYLLREGELGQLTQDQTLVARLLAEGVVTAEEAERLPIAHVITQALGSEEDIDVVHHREALRRGDVLLLCTDGLSGLVRHGDIEDALRRGGDLPDMCARLVALAEARGGTDNVTVVLGRVE